MWQSIQVHLYINGNGTAILVKTMYKFGQQLFIQKWILMYELISFQSSTYGYNHVWFENIKEYHA